ncbi:glucosaminidase domain-containing protein [Aureitalea marina]|uniref:Peptidoglycan hydrolase n=1 Tax=Aureitalea marina TaxID=930804 RepID=A0A2S7KR02_9FLAO|nr:glucosaminidase domain-containing protein [Aureitalea marina]PQB05018.1 N-acetylmuramidase [Aureitalea marina]
MRPYLLGIILLSLVLGCKPGKEAVSKNETRKERKERKERPKPETTRVEPSREKEPIPANATYTQVVDIYIRNYQAIAMEEMEIYGIPASITLAQGILESGAGRGQLSRKSNNHFGIKCHTTWNGARVYHDDDEKGECFRRYEDPDDSFRDHSLFLTKRSRYASLFKLKQSDYKGWAKGLKKAGYATDPKYPSKLIKIIERYDLERFDKMVLKGNWEPPAQDIVTTTPSGEVYVVSSGDTLYSIARRFNLTVDKLKAYNKLNGNLISVGQTLYLQPTENR